MKRLLAIVFICSAFLLTGCGSSTAEFCEVVTTADAQMDTGGINDYYGRLEAAAPDEIKNDVTTLRKGWQLVSFPLGEAAGGKVKNMSRPPEVSAAAESVANYMVEQCGVELGEGIYLAFPEVGW
jgi:hypothetical protein